MQICGIFLFCQYPNDNNTSLDSQRQMLSNEPTYLNVANKVEINQTKEFKNCYFQYIFMNWIISVIYGTKLIKFETYIAECHSDFVCRP